MILLSSGMTWTSILCWRNHQSGNHGICEKMIKIATFGSLRRYQVFESFHQPSRSRMIQIWQIQIQMGQISPVIDVFKLFNSVLACFHPERSAHQADLMPKSHEKPWQWIKTHHFWRRLTSKTHHLFWCSLEY